MRAVAREFACQALVLLACAGALAVAPPPGTPAGPGRKSAPPATPGTAPATFPDTPADPATLAPADPITRDTLAQKQYDEWRRTHGDKAYRYGQDAKHRLLLATCLDETSQAEMLAMIAAQADQQAATLFAAPPGYQVFVAIATPADAKAIFNGSATTSGMYEHPQHRLVSADIGSVLRHEFTHAMHFGHMERLNQPHPIWVQEGLASLYETYDLRPDGSLEFLPNPRHNQARDLASRRASVPFAQVMAMDPDAFMQRSQALYPQVRSMFEFLADVGKLRQWYRRYTETFAQDRTGRRAMEDVFGKPIAKVEDDWRAWVLKRPAVANSATAMRRSVGVEVTSVPDGVKVTKVDRRSAAQRAGIQAGDVIVQLAGAPVRSVREWDAAVGALRAPEVAVVVRRGTDRLEMTLRMDDQASANPRTPLDNDRTASIGPETVRPRFPGPVPDTKVEMQCTSPSAPSTWTSPRPSASTSIGRWPSCPTSSIACRRSASSSSGSPTATTSRC
jgi:hypothetical protein